jgi:AraC family transcriptional regulator, regulatory protein of adaptative response / methylphosphotriester-DNA alkyltransferase methyltransferase
MLLFLIFTFIMHQTIKPTTISVRKKEIVQQYLSALDKHILDLKEGKANVALEIKEFAKMLHVHPVHLSNTIKEVTGQSTCCFYESRLLAVSKELLLTTSMTIAQIAHQLTYDPSNFTKFFKHFTGITPKQFRNQQG